MVKHYEGFLAAAASITPRVNAKMVADAAQDILGIDKHVAKNFGKAMETAFGHCKAKQRCMTSGAKLTASVKSEVRRSFGDVSIIR